MKRILVALLTLVLALVLVGEACAKPAPSPSPAPAPAPKPSPTAAPAPAPSPTASPAPAPKPHAKVELQFNGASIGTTAQLYAEAFAKIVNDAKHPWLSASSIQTFGGVDNVKRNGDDPALRKTAIFHSDAMVNKMAVGGEQPAFTKPYPGLKSMVFTGIFGMAVITLDPNIKKPEDLYGKKVGLQPKGAAVNQWSYFMLRDCWGLDMTKIKEQNLSWDDSKTAMLDGTLDAYVFAITNVAGKWAVHPSFDTPFLTRKVYFVGHTRADVAKGSKVAGISASYMEVPAGALGEKQATAIGTSILHNSYFAYQDMEEEVAYEATKVLYTNVDRIGTFFSAGKGTVAKTYGWYPVASESDVHPGALKYFKENKIPVFVGDKTPFD
ncbi:MAG: TAXI family TRAP transporter solute-binding subunit [Chloroflexota bacterium]